MKQPLSIHLNQLGKKSLYIKELKGFYTPVELATQLNELLEQKMVGVDWHRKKIYVHFSFNDMFSKKNKFNSYERAVPEQMKTKKLIINKPYLK